MPQVFLLGIRHHGPGSAYSVVQALTALQPDLILIEGPPEAEAVLPLAGAIPAKWNHRWPCWSMLRTIGRSRFLSLCVFRRNGRRCAMG